MEQIALAILRVTVGTVFVGHGWPKVFGDAEAEHGWARTSKLLGSTGFPQPVLAAKALGLVEVVAGLLVLVGLFTRLAVIPLIVVVATAVPMVKWKKGFIEGWDFPLTLVATGIFLALVGGGTYSLEELLLGAG